MKNKDAMSAKNCFNRLLKINVRNYFLSGTSVIMLC